MGDYAAEIQLLHLKVEATRYQFLLAEIKTCALTLDFARWQYERGNTPFAEREWQSALKAIATIERFLPETNPEQQRDVKEKLADLRTSVESVRQQLLGKSDC
jgi:hypothetical protein